MWVSKWFILPELGQGQGKRSWGWGESHRWSLIYKKLHFLMEITRIKWKEKHCRRREQHKEMHTNREMHGVTREWEVSIRESNRR